MVANMLIKPLANDRHEELTRAMDFKALDYLQSGNVEGKALDCSQPIEL